MEQLLVGLLLWISQNTTFDYQPEMGLPAVEQVSQMKLARLFVGEGVTAQGYLSNNDKEEAYKEFATRLVAIYASDRNTIYLGVNADPKTAYGRAVLVHELVHFLQNKYNHHKDAPCLNALEKDAYTIQAKYMRAHNMEPEFDKFTILMRSLCDLDTL